MSISHYLANKENDHLIGKATYTPPATLYLALCTAAPSASDTGSTITETGYTSYARLAVTGSDFENSGDTTAAIISNTSILTFAESTGGSSGTITHVALVDAASGGNLLQFTALDSSITASTNEAPRVTAGNLKLRRL